MSQEEFTDWHKVSGFLNQRKPFVLYRIPGESHIHFIQQESKEVHLLHNLEELGDQKGFIAVPFQTTAKCPIVLMQPEPRVQFLPIESGEKERNSFLSASAEFIPSPCQQEYDDCFHKFIAALNNKQFDKLVLSRSLQIAKPKEFSPLAAFRTACLRYTYSYTYLYYTPQTGMWMGSTPEILLSGKGNQWHTMALAGTQPLQQGKLPQEWDEKNRKEQDYVSTYIRRQLLLLGIHAEEKGPYPAYAGALSHLKTDFYFTLDNHHILSKLLNALHPTPAVCGLPKEEAYHFIVQHEGHNRSYYSGFLGWFAPEGQTDLYVNLRCMHIGEGMLTLYAGGGLLPTSKLEDEWMETEKKLQTMKSLTTFY